MSDSYNLLFQFTIQKQSFVIFTSLYAYCNDVRGSIRGTTNIASMTADIQFVMLNSSGTQYYSSIKHSFSTSVPQGGTTNQGSFSYNTSSYGMTLPAGTYKMYLVLSNVIGNCSGYYGNTGSMYSSGNTVAGSVRMSITPITEQKTVIGIDGLLTIKNALQYFMVDNTGSSQKYTRKV